MASRVGFLKAASHCTWSRVERTTAAVNIGWQLHWQQCRITSEQVCTSTEIKFGRRYQRDCYLLMTPRCWTPYAVFFLYFYLANGLFVISLDYFSDDDEPLVTW